MVSLSISARPAGHLPLAASRPVGRRRDPERPVRVLGIGGSVGAGCRSTVVLAAALRRAEDLGAETAMADVRALGLPLFDIGIPLDRYPPSLPWLLDQVREADAFLLCSPTYHGTVAGGVKNALDALEFLARDEPRYLGGKAVGLLALGGGDGIGAAGALDALHHVTRALNGVAVPTHVAVPGGAVDPIAQIVTDEAVEARLAMMVGQVVDLGRRLRRD